ncbi:MAG: hypothetical protein ABGX25_01320, partial [Nautiliaceae bacterium]
ASLKDKGYVFGVYGNYFFPKHKIEFDAEHTKIKYKEDTNIDDWKQNDFTIIGHFYQGYNLAYKAGIHNIWVKQGDDSKYDKVFILGILYYKYLKYNAGIDLYYSDYEDNGGFKIIQVSPKVGFNFGNYYSKIGSFYTEVKYNHIHLNKDNITPKDNYSNVDMKLQNFQGPWTTTLNLSFGKSAYKVANDGFVVYTTGDEYKYSAGLSVNYAISKKESIKVGYIKSKYNNGSSNCYSNVYTLSYSRAF